MPKLVRGSDLVPTARVYVLAAFGYRWTVENEERARKWFGNRSPTAPLTTDAEWLSAHAFFVKRNGQLAGGTWNTHARSSMDLDTPLAK